MAIGKNKKLGKKKKQGSRKPVDPFTKKDWFDVKAPSCFPIRQVGKTFATRSQGQRLSKDSLMGRVFTASLGDLKPQGDDDAFRKFKLRVEDVQGSQCLTNFAGMDLTTDKVRSLVRKMHTMIEAHVDVKTTDGYLIRMFSIGFTQKRKNQQRETSYAQSSQVRKIRKKMVDVMSKKASSVDLSGLVSLLIPEVIGRDIEKACSSIYPLTNVFVRKVKVLKCPKTDLNKLMELHGGAEAIKAADLANLALGQQLARGTEEAATEETADE